MSVLDATDFVLPGRADDGGLDISVTRYRPRNSPTSSTSGDTYALLLIHGVSFRAYFILFSVASHRLLTHFSLLQIKSRFFQPSSISFKYSPPFKRAHAPSLKPGFSTRLTMDMPEFSTPLDCYLVRWDSVRLV